MKILSILLLFTSCYLSSIGQLDIYTTNSPSIDSSDLQITNLFNQKLYDNALSLLNKAIQDNPEIGINYFNRAVVKYYKFGQNNAVGVDTSIYNDCKRAINNGYDTPELHYLMFSVLQPNLALYDENGDRTDVTFEDAKIEIDKAIENSTKRPIKYKFARMILLYQQFRYFVIGRENQASEPKLNFKQAKTLKSDCEFILAFTKSSSKIGISNYILSQLSYHNENDTLSAIRLLTEAITADTSRIRYVQERARMKYETGNYTGAITDYLKYLAKEKRPEDFLKLGNCYALVNDKAKAISNYTKCISLINSELQVITQNQEKRNTQIIDNYAGSIRAGYLKQKMAEAYYYRGITYIELNNKHKACEDLNKATDYGDKEAQKEIIKNCQ